MLYNLVFYVMELSGRPHRYALVAYVQPIRVISESKGSTLLYCNNDALTSHRPLSGPYRSVSVLLGYCISRIFGIPPKKNFPFYFQYRDCISLPNLSALEAQGRHWFGSLNSFIQRIDWYIETGQIIFFWVLVD